MPPHIFMLCSYVVMLAACGFAALRGGEAERWGAAAICGQWLVGGLVLLMTGLGASHSGSVSLMLLAADAALAVALLILALRFTKLWLGAAMLLQGLLLALHAAAMAEFGLSFATYASFNDVTSTGLIALLVGATFMAQKKGLRPEAHSKLSASRS
jgi:hypothetical protein